MRESDAARVLGLLGTRAASLATAESLTGGRLAAAVTAVPGASAAYLGGVVSYATEVKVSVLGVPPSLVASEGVVSEACAVAMAEGVRRLLGASYGVATTGVAGPTEQEGKPVGTVFVAVAGPGGTVPAALELPGDRGGVVERTVAEALALLEAVLAGRPEDGATPPRG